MTTAILSGNSAAYIDYDNSSQFGASPESQMVANFIEKIKADASGSISLGWKYDLINQSIEISSECSSQDWDGYGAQPIEFSNTMMTCFLITLLPDGIVKPAIVPAANGSLSLEWHSPNNEIISISLEGRNLIYAGFLGGKKTYGEIPIYLEFPEELSKILRKYFFDNIAA